MNNIEQTLSIIKPDAVERNLENDIKQMFKDNSFKIVDEKKIQIENLKLKSFIKFMKLSLFIVIYAHIYHQVQLLL